ncbi:predicted protein [Chaetoceros tenuissimus]|uniref:SAP domain-containing protein n=1 Tax=Chaetoceros tenuissimus TaxID=426638 RepID=A0AAD3H661_9STRA|nr:predicted protein [Chaetoceros tenuissimus]
MVTLNKDSIDKLDYNELRKACKDAGVNGKGTIEELKSRLLMSQKEEKVKSAAKRPQKHKGFEKFQYRDIQATCTKYNINGKGPRETLIKRLKDNGITPDQVLPATPGKKIVVIDSDSDDSNSEPEETEEDDFDKIVKAAEADAKQQKDWSRKSGDNKSESFLSKAYASFTGIFSFGFGTKRKTETIHIDEKPVKRVKK